jgi:hypothetical protein
MRGSGTKAERIRVCEGFALSLLTDTHPIIVYLLVESGKVVLYPGTANRFLPASCREFVLSYGSRKVKHIHAWNGLFSRKRIYQPI